MRTIKHAPYLLLHALQRQYAGVIICVILSILLSFKDFPFRNDIVATVLISGVTVIFLFLLKEITLYQRVAEDISVRIENFLGVNPESISGNTDEDRVNKHIASRLYAIKDDADKLHEVKQDILLEVYNEVSLDDRVNISDTAIQITFALLLGYIILQAYKFVTS